MKSSQLIRFGNLTLVFGLLATTVGASLLFLPDTADAAPQFVVQPKTWLTPSALSVDWEDQHAAAPVIEPAPTEAPIAPVATNTPTATPEPAPAPTEIPTELAAADPDAAAFADLRVTVSQTQNLVNQGIRITWTGGTATSPGEYAANYLQIMQCWGDDPAGPTPQQCQWGAPNATIGNLTGTNAAGRNLLEGEDPLQAYTADIKRTPPRTNPNLRSFAFPFTPVKGASDFDPGKYFTAATTNEVTAARTGSNGTGSVSFEAHTSLEAPHLGCGAATDSGATRDCWLVIVPRGEHNLDGSLASSSSAAGRVKGSPLSAGAWKNRIVVKLGFQPVAVSCPIGNSETRVVGSELLADAFTSWQPALCSSGTTYGFSQIGDSEGRRQIVTDVEGGSKLAFVTDPLDSAIAGDSTIAYAPIASSAIVVGYSIDYSLNANAANFSKNGTMVNDLVLSARLVAKLLTQSYRVDVPGLGTGDPILSGNPRSLITDPEFLALNPEFLGFANLTAPDGLLVALGSSDANAHVWQWLKSDPLAASFLAGDSDEWGMRINPQYKTLELATANTDSFPKADLTTYQLAPAPEPGFGTLDLRPYMSDMHESAYRALRADAGVKIVWDDTKTPAGYVSTGPQLPGQRLMLALTDAASAERYGLNTARLVNGAGQATPATTETVTRAITAMTDSEIPGVKLNNPTARTLGAYPLSMPTYAAINVCATPKATLLDYADLLTYASGPGQSLGDAKGQLPIGYVALDEKNKKVVATVVAKLKKEATGKGACTVREPVAEEFEEIAPDFGFEEDTSEEPEVAPTADPEDVELATTKDAPLSPARLGILASLALGLPCLLGGPLLSRRGRKLSDLGEL
ncbi:hypothetical protein EYE40_06190 [Glaciihabitans arcticus]|uniref:PBP domain-containing protein n=1 Tax=Glaciihabitans arcticus TaxID=2668039 RepID=A0A4Q9GQT1_9MICO|nr:hypothetical protein [Glaciihabitans arcticus]TBN57021.1 hypothetical protein EYE40_06190 [Glaciihabitans arcticus]